MRSVDIDWQRALVALGEMLIDRDRSDLGPILRQFHAVLCTAPAPVANRFGAPCDQATLERLITATAPRELAFCLIGNAPYVAIISRGPEGRVLATVEIDGLFAEAHGDGSDEAGALVAAIAGGLARWSSDQTVVSSELTRH